MPDTLPTPTIPFTDPPEIEEYRLPEETSDDPLEREASRIIDAAIARAIACVNAVKDDRHSYVSFGYDEDANGYVSALLPEEKGLFDSVLADVRALRSFTVYEKEYAGDLKHALFALDKPLTYADPAVSSYFMLDAQFYLKSMEDDTRVGSIFEIYFDPYMDANTSVSRGKVTLEAVREAVSLLDHVAKRVVRFMPEGLSTYDKYYYLAAVLSERVTYDMEPRSRYTAFGALVEGRAVCEGYSLAYALLCREADLWCAFRSGLPRGEGHAWNMIMLEDGIYNVDVTWCDVTDPYRERWYEYFVKSDADFEDHAATSGIASTGVFAPNPYEAAG